MQTSDTLNPTPLLIGLALSIALHGALLCSRRLCTPPVPRADAGLTVVQLTLIPSPAARTAAAPAPPDMSMPTALIEPAGQVSAPAAQPAEEQTAAAAEQDGSPIEEKGVESDAAPVDPLRADYPRASRRRGEEGVVRLSVEVLASGCSGRITVLESSGHRRLDEAACAAARGTRFSPATRFGDAVDSATELSFTFRLTDD